MSRMNNELQQQAHQYYLEGNYALAASYYERAIADNPEIKSYYWHLGLMLLLDGKPGEAQATWLMAMLEGESEQMEAWNGELVALLEQEAVRQDSEGKTDVAYSIRQQIQELSPTDLNNLLHLLRLAIQQDCYTGEELTDWEILPQLRTETPKPLDFQLLKIILQDVLRVDPFNPLAVELAEVSLSYGTTEPQMLALINLFLTASGDIGYAKKRPDIAAKLCEFALRIDPQCAEAVNQLARFYQNSEQFDCGIEMAKFYSSLVKTLPDRAFASKGIIRSLMATGGHWQEAYKAFREHEAMLQSLLEEQPTDLAQLQVLRLYNTYFFAPYFRDCPRKDRPLQNQIAQLCQINTDIQRQELIEKYQQGHQQRLTERRKKKQPLKIGYLSHCFKSHSVGWLTRSLFEHHNRDRVELHAYMITTPTTTEPLMEWYRDRAAKTYKSTQIEELAEQIYQDEIDILIELDSLTLDVGCAVTALKPAPVQVGWLGWDASGVPTIDYFIADPYVLPDNAQDYYNEKIWRLPHTYLAVDGFEVDIPTLRREHLEIEPDAIVYYSAQNGYKRHLETVRLQMRILKAVPNSYFAIKGAADVKAVKTVFEGIAEEEGVDKNRLRFLSVDPSEAIHRANLGIADIVLDTYPYNGATTTMETLWRGIPLVTQVGEQFAARNSYTMMVNAGVRDGIAWTPEEYLDWGIRFGTDETLRQKVTWQLRQSRHNAPLWNGKQFTREMERAYEQMWEKYCQFKA